MPDVVETVTDAIQNLQEQPIDCPSGEKQITAFQCGPCPDGYNCLDPNDPTLCQEGTYADETSTSCKTCEKGIGFKQLVGISKKINSIRNI